MDGVNGFELHFNDNIQIHVTSTDEMEPYELKMKALEAQLAQLFWDLKEDGTGTAALEERMLHRVLTELGTAMIHSTRGAYSKEERPLDAVKAAVTWLQTYRADLGSQS